MSKYLPHIVPDVENKKKMFCKLTALSLNPIAVEIERHMKEEVPAIEAGVRRAGGEEGAEAEGKGGETQGTRGDGEGWHLDTY